jgi:hypothetical protein
MQPVSTCVSEFNSLELVSTHQTHRAPPLDGMGPADDLESENAANAPHTRLSAFTPSNVGNFGFEQIGDAALADADPLGANTNVAFAEVGGLDDRLSIFSYLNSFF